MRRASEKRAFTLVELLVVIGIIAILVSVLLPSLAAARRSANNVACAANLRSILQGMQMFASQNNGQIPGSATTTARFLYKTGPTDLVNAKRNLAFGPGACPGIVQVFDWASPIAKTMGLHFNENGDDASRLIRFQQLRDMQVFRCPNNDILAGPYAGSVPVVPAGPMMSYCAAMGFLVQSPGGIPGDGVTTSPSSSGSTTPYWNVPSSYNVRLGKVGNGALKAFIADGAKYSTVSAQPDADISVFGSNGGIFADQGVSSVFSRAWSRMLAPGNGTAGTWDTRMWWARHGNPRTGRAAKGGAFRVNVGFFDGHVETLDDLSASNPQFWWPKGTVVPNSSTEICADTRAAFSVPASNYIVP